MLELPLDLLPMDLVGETVLPGEVGLVEEPDLLLATLVLILSFTAPDLLDKRVVLLVGVAGSAIMALSLPDLPAPLAFLA